MPARATTFHGSRRRTSGGRIGSSRPTLQASPPELRPRVSKAPGSPAAATPTHPRPRRHTDASHHRHRSPARPHRHREPQRPARPAAPEPSPAELLQPPAPLPLRPPQRQPSTRSPGPRPHTTENRQRNPAPMPQLPSQPGFPCRPWVYRLRDRPRKASFPQVNNANKRTAGDGHLRETMNGYDRSPKHSAHRPRRSRRADHAFGSAAHRDRKNSVIFVGYNSFRKVCICYKLKTSCAQDKPRNGLASKRAQWCPRSDSIDTPVPPVCRPSFLESHGEDTPLVAGAQGLDLVRCAPAVLVRYRHRCGRVSLRGVDRWWRAWVVTVVW